MKKVLGIGNALVDILVRIESDTVLASMGLKKGSMQLVDAIQSHNYLQQCANYPKQTASGGSAANAIHGFSKLGGTSGYIGKIGTDEYGQLFADDLQRNGIAPILSVGKDKTGIALALISPDSERTFATCLGAAVEISANDLTEQQFKNYDWLHLEGYLAFNHELLDKALVLAKRLGLKLSIDLASFNVVEANKDFLQRIVKQSHIVFANEDEARAYTGEEPMKAVARLAEECTIAVVKTGSSGSIVQTGNTQHIIPVEKANCIDTTGAGDLYAAGFLYGMCKDWPLEKCGRAGSITAGAVVEVIGAKIPEERWIIIREKLAKL